jgi:hypothetical protein
MGGGNRQVHVTYEICLRITPTLDQRILERARVLLLKHHARHLFPDRWRGRWLLGLLRRWLLSYCRAAAEDCREGDRCSHRHHDKQVVMLRRELIRAAT